LSLYKGYTCLTFNQNALIAESPDTESDLTPHWAEANPRVLWEYLGSVSIQLWQTAPREEISNNPTDGLSCLYCYPDCFT